MTTEPKSLDDFYCDDKIGKAQKKRNENFYIFDEFDTLADRYVYVYVYFV